ncbi:hypothetical protein [Butyrivibrio sp. VCB2006]|uniref:hypothetical protein n=1 Tax=Butyrivibrio sp. VCB2006 TaxID=1280679 RepID=UPI0003FF9B09|nr:hypothetical protein [Butyrivibrio sp. VCB2006]
MKRLGIILVFVFSILVNVYFGFQKSGFHEDEYYTYYSTNRSIGLYQPDRQWQDRQTILDEFVVKPGEGFNYGLVKLVQSWDVHPPLYYMIFHTICSFATGVFTKWPGIITNLIAFSLTFLVLDLILRRLRASYFVEVMALLFYGVNPQTISCNMLIRMYAWLSLFVALCAYLHIRMVQEYDEKKAKEGFGRFFLTMFLPIMITSYLGFLTQYFYLFFFVSIGVAFAAWLVFVRKDIRLGAIYVISCAVSLALAVFTYPASVHHMLGGYRGNEAAGSIFDIGNTVMRLSFFAGLLNDFVFAGVLWVLGIVILVGLGYKLYLKKANGLAPEFVIFAVGVIGYFLITAKAALLVGSASNRYEMPAYGLVIVIVAVLLQRALRLDTSASKGVQLAGKIMMLAAGAVLLFKGIVVDDRVLFMYPEDKDKIAYAAENHDQVAVVMYNPATPHNVWRLTDELLEYDKVFYMDEENTEPITEDNLINAGKIILYVADDESQDEALDNLKKSTGKEQMELQSFEDMWVTYELK